MKKLAVRVCVLFCMAVLLTGLTVGAKGTAGNSLDDARDDGSAVNKVRYQVSRMDELRKRLGNAQSVEKITHIAENAISQYNTIKIEDWIQELTQTSTGGDWMEEWVKNWNANHIITINNTVLSALENRLQELQHQTEVEEILADGHIETFRQLARFITFKTTSQTNILLSIDPDILRSDREGNRYIRVETTEFIVSFNPQDLDTDLSQRLLIGLEDDDREPDPKVTVTIYNLGEKQKLGGFFTLSIPITESEHLDNLVMVNTAIKNSGSDSKETDTGNEDNKNMRPVVSVPNSIKSDEDDYMDGRISESGVYSVGSCVGRTFLDTDDDQTTPEEQEAIRILTEYGILNGYSDNTFRPTEPVKRGHFVKAIMPAIGKVDTEIKTSFFPDLYNQDGKELYCFFEANTAYKLDILQGYSDGCFHSDEFMSRQALCKIAGLILVNERDYKLPINPAALLKKHYLESDVDKIDSKCLAPIALLWELEIIDEGEFDATGAISRAQMAVIVSKIVKKMFP